MDPFTARMLERARDRQRRVDERTGSAAAPAPARSPLRAGAATNSELDGARQTVKAASPRRPAAEQREDKENHPNALHASTRSRLKQLGSLYSTDGDTDLDAYDVEVTPRHSRAEPEPSPPRPALTSSSSSSSSGSSAGLRGRLAGLACQYQQLESEEAQGFTPSGSRSRLVYDFADPSRSPSPPRVVSAVTKPSPERPAAPYRSASPVRYSPPPRPQPSSPTSRPASEYNPPARDWSPERQGSPTRQLSPMRQLSPVRGRLVQERAAVFDRAASPPPPNVDPTEMTLSDRRKLFEKGQPPKVIARFGTPVTPHMLRQRAAAEPPPPPAAPAAFRRAAAEQSRSRPALEEMRSRSPVRQTGPSSSPQPPPEGPPSPSRAVGESTFQAHRKLWESMNNDWRQNDIAQSSRQQRDKELGYLANRWQHKPAELEQAATAAKHLEEMAPPAPPAAAIPPPPPPPSPPPPAPASPPARRPGAASSPVRRPGAANSPVRRPGTASSPVRHSEPAPEFQQSAGNSVTSPASTVYRPGDESTVSYASGHSDAESLGAEILAMARANQPPPSLPTIDESSADSSSDMSGMAACAAIDDVLDDMDQEEDDPTPPKRTRTTPLRRCTSQPETAVSPSVAQLIRRFQLPPPRPAPRHRRSAPCLGTRPPAARTSGARPPTMRTSTPRRSASVTSVTSADVTAVTAAARGGSDSALMAGGAGESPERSVSLPDAELTSASADMTFVPPDLTSATADLTAVPPDLAFVRLDLTSAPADLTAVPPDLGAVSWSGRSPRCWEEAVAAEEAGGEPASAPHSRLRQYLFGAGAAGAAAETPDGAANGATGAGCGSGEGAAGVGRGAVESEWDNGEGAAEAEWGTGEDGKWTEWGSGEDGTWTEWGALKTERVDGEGAGSVSDLVSQLEAVCLRRGGGDGEPETHPQILPSSGVRHKRQESGVFRTPMATCVLSPEQDPNLPSVVLDGDGAEMPLMHSVSFYRRQRPQEVRVTPVRPVVRNREVARYPEEPSSSGQQQQLAAGTQERIKQLQKEATQQMNVMSQASQALNLCNSTIEFTGSAEMVEAERLLLVATHRRQAALSEIQRLKTEGAMRQQGIVRSASRGSLSVSSVTLPVKSSFVREVAAGSANYVYYFVVLLRYRGQVITTQMLSSEDSIKGNAINFPNLVSFRELESDFGVALEVYGLQAPRELLPHDAKYHIRKDRAKTPKKLLKQQSALTSPAVQSPAGPGAVRATSFQLMGFLHLTARNLANNSWALEKVPSQSPLDGGVLMTVTCHADCAVEERGFVTVFDDVSGFGAWHRRWAALSGGRLSFWKYPEDEQRAPPVAEVDLRRCVTERVGPVPRDICARQNTLLLVTVRQARPNDADSLVMQRRGAMTRLRHLLSLDIRDERQLWTDKLNETLANIRAWDPDAMQPHLDPSA